MFLTMNPTPSQLPHYNHSNPALTNGPLSSRSRSNSTRPAVLSRTDGAITKRNSYSQRKSPSVSNIRNLQAVLPETIDSASEVSPRQIYSYSDTQSRPSPQKQSFFELVPHDSADWSMPTPPRSDSGIAQTIGTSGVSFPLAPAASTSHQAPQAGGSGDMSTLGYMVPAQYGQLSSDDPSYPSGSGYTFDPNYRMAAHSQPDAQTYDMSSSYNQAAMRTTSPTQMYHPTSHSYSSHNPYGLGYGHMPSSVTRSMSSPMPAPTLGSSNHQGSYGSQYDRSSSVYDASMYGSPTSTAQPLAAQTSPTLNYSSQQYAPSSQSYPRAMSTASSTGSSSVRVLNQKAKPQCWEHGCNGREFSTFSNLLRHQREKSGTATKSYCPNCGAEFTRTTARNGHLAHDKCSKQSRSSAEQQ